MPQSINDKLAIDRTKLANERTFLAYFRTFIVLLSSGIAIMKLEFLEGIYFLGIILIIVAPIILLIGIIQYYRIKKRIRSYSE